MTFQRACLTCGQPIIGRGARAIYCGPNCNQVAAYRRRHGAPVVRTACEQCGAPLTPGARGTKPKWCSARCRRQAAYAQEKADGRAEASAVLRRTRKRTADAERVSRRTIFERDGWRCWICGDDVDRTAKYPAPLSASLDHVVPLMHGGAHRTDNARCAHLRCNHIRGNQSRRTSA